MLKYLRRPTGPGIVIVSDIYSRVLMSKLSLLTVGIVKDKSIFFRNYLIGHLWPICVNVYWYFIFKKTSHISGFFDYFIYLFIFFSTHFDVFPLIWWWWWWRYQKSEKPDLSLKKSLRIILWIQFVCVGLTRQWCVI